jgi:hypothetical protein
MARSDSGTVGSTNAKVTTRRGEQMWQAEHAISFDAPGFSQLLHDNGNLVAFMSGGKRVATFDPEVGFARPFEVGKTVTTNHRAMVPGKAEPLPLQLTQKVEAYEDVTLPAGTFKAYRISWSESTGVENVYWLSLERGISVKSVLTRNAKVAAGPGRRENELLCQTIRKQSPHRSSSRASPKAPGPPALFGEPAATQD